MEAGSVTTAPTFRSTSSSDLNITGGNSQVGDAERERRARRPRVRWQLRVDGVGLAVPARHHTHDPRRHPSQLVAAQSPSLSNATDSNLETAPFHANPRRTRPRRPEQCRWSNPFAKLVKPSLEQKSRMHLMLSKFAVLTLVAVPCFTGCAAESTADLDADVNSSEAAYSHVPALLHCHGVGQWDPFLHIKGELGADNMSVYTNKHQPSVVTGLTFRSERPGSATFTGTDTRIDVSGIVFTTSVDGTAATVRVSSSEASYTFSGCTVYRGLRTVASR